MIHPLEVSWSVRTRVYVGEEEGSTGFLPDYRVAPSA
jgi:hypothetical protein